MDTRKLSTPLFLPWLAACEHGSPYTLPSTKYENMQPPTILRAVDYHGRRIAAVPYSGAVGKVDTMGFDTPVAYIVLDEFDEPALPVLTQWFWSPHDAAAAVRFVDWIGPYILARKANWPTTVEYEFELAMAYRRKFSDVYAALKDIERLCQQDDAENAKREIAARLGLLRQVVAEGTLL